MTMLKADPRFTGLPVGEYDVMFTGWSRKQGKHNAYIALYFDVVTGDYAGHFRGVYQYHNCLPLWYKHDGENGDGGVGSMSQMRMDAITATYRNYVTISTERMMAAADASGCDMDSFDAPRAPEFDAVQCFLSDDFDSFIGKMCHIRVEECSDGRNLPNYASAIADPVAMMSDPTYTPASLCSIERRAMVNGIPTIEARYINPPQITPPEVSELNFDRLNGIYVDSRQRACKHDMCHAELIRMGYELITVVLDTGDYMLARPATGTHLVSVDTKTFNEFFGSNMHRSDFSRIEAECQRAIDNGIKLWFVINTERPEIPVTQSSVDMMIDGFVHPKCASCFAQCDGMACSVYKGWAVPESGAALRSKLSYLVDRYGVGVFFVNSPVNEANAIHGLLTEEVM